MGPIKQSKLRKILKEKKQAAGRGREKYIKNLKKIF